VKASVLIPAVIFGKAVAGRVAVNTADLVQPSRQTHRCECDPDPLPLWLLVLMYWVAAAVQCSG